MASQVAIIGGDERSLLRLCIDAATQSADAVELWRRQRRTLQRLPSPIAAALFHSLLLRRLLYPSILEIFKYNIEEVDLSGESSVDAEWMAYLGAFHYLASLKLADCHKINNHALWPIVGLTNLKDVDLSRCSKVTDAGIRHLLSATNLEKLYISETSVTSEGVSLLSILANLSVLDLGGLHVSDMALCSLQTLTKLQYLDLWGSDISNKGACILNSFPELSFLSLAWTKVTDLPYMSSLTCLNMSNCKIGSIFHGYGDKSKLLKLILSGITHLNVSEAFLYFEASFLSFLDLSNCSLDDFNFLSRMNALEYLDLSSNMMDDDSVHLIALVGAKLRFLNLNKTRITSAGVSFLAGNVPKLEELLLSDTAIDDIALSYVSLMPSLKVIDISKTNIKGFIRQMGSEPDIPSFAALQNLTNLERLNMEETKVADEALDSLSGLRKLNYLSFRSNFLTDMSFYQLSSLQKLTHLSVRDAVLTNAGLEFFNPPKTLKTLDLRGCWLLTEDALLLFCKKFPKIEIRHELVLPLHRDKSIYLSPSQGNFKSLNLKHRYGKLILSPLLSKDSTFLDQRLKYSREELLALQLSSSSPFRVDERGTV